MPASRITWVWGGDTEDEKVDLLIAAIEELKHRLNIPDSIHDVIPEVDKRFYAEVEEMAENAFDDQCTGANPRYPMIKELKELYILAHRGCRIDSALYHQDDQAAIAEAVNA